MPVCRSGFLPPPSRVRAAELLIDPPALIELGFEWLVEADDNQMRRWSRLSQERLTTDTSYSLVE